MPSSGCGAELLTDIKCRFAKKEKNKMSSKLNMKSQKAEVDSLKSKCQMIKWRKSSESDTKRWRESRTWLSKANIQPEAKTAMNRWPGSTAKCPHLEQGLQEPGHTGAQHGADRTRQACCGHFPDAGLRRQGGPSAKASTPGPPGGDSNTQRGRKPRLTQDPGWTGSEIGTHTPAQGEHAQQEGRHNQHKGRFTQT